MPSPSIVERDGGAGEREVACLARDLLEAEARADAPPGDAHVRQYLVGLRAPS